MQSKSENMQKLVCFKLAIPFLTLTEYFGFISCCQQQLHCSIVLRFAFVVNWYAYVTVTVSVCVWAYEICRVTFILIINAKLLVFTHVTVFFLYMCMFLYMCACLFVVGVYKQNLFDWRGNLKLKLLLKLQ